MLLQYMDERDSGLAILSEPYRVPTDDPRWIASDDKTAAILWRKATVVLPINKVEAGQGFVIAKWGNTFVVSVYMSPRLNIEEVEDRLDRIARFVATFGARFPVIIAGDFNAHAELWGSRRSDPRGRLLLDWAISTGLYLINQGSDSTCVRPQGESVVDLTWATPMAARLLDEWKVVTKAEILSDHRLIEMKFAVGRDNYRQNGKNAARKWSVKKLDPDIMTAALLACAWSNVNMEDEERPLEERVEELRDIMFQACDAAMPRQRAMPRKATYWWTQDIDGLRKQSIKAQRRWLRARQRRHPIEDVEEKRNIYREARKDLSKAISKAKSQAWEDLLLDLNEDPWGKAYQIVREKLRRGTVPITEQLEPELLDEVTGTLFPEPNNHRHERDPNWPPPSSQTSQWREEWEVSQDEASKAVLRMRERNAAPGPDGIQSAPMSLIYKIMEAQIRSVFTGCLKKGWFPDPWKRANLILLHKQGKPEGLPSSYRPICLLDESGKILERILAGRIVHHLASVGPDLHEGQYGFRRSLSTIDAIMRVKSFTQEQMQHGGVVVAISLDISNAFNSLPWCCIMEALERHNVPEYLRAVLRSYLDNRELKFRDRNGVTRTKQVRRGVPQGSVLGPLLWNITYNKVLTDTTLPPRCTTVCYADDTLVLAAGDTWRQARARADEAIAAVVEAIGSLDLKVAPSKTEALCFQDGTHGDAPELEVTVSGTRVRLGPQIKYLGLTLDDRWEFLPHFEKLAIRLQMVVNQCTRIMPNLGGPGGKARRMFATVANSVALYGAPVWAKEAGESKKISAILRAAQRSMAIRIIRGYRTTSFAAATLLAGVAPIQIHAEMHAEVHNETRRLRSLQNRELNAWQINAIKIIARRKFMIKWRDWANDPSLQGGKEIRKAIAPRLVEWADRRWGQLSFRATQILTGHGCFGRYLCRIGREATPECHHCGDPLDSVRHTLVECPAWAEEREKLRTVIGRELNLSRIVRKMIRGEHHWTAVIKFCEAVMLKKEDAERARRGEACRGEVEEQQRLQNPRARPRQRGRRRRRQEQQRRQETEAAATATVAAATTTQDETNALTATVTQDSDEEERDIGRTLQGR